MPRYWFIAFIVSPNRQQQESSLYDLWIASVFASYVAHNRRAFLNAGSMRPRELVEYLPLSLVKITKATQFEGTLNISMLESELKLYVASGQAAISNINRANLPDFRHWMELITLLTNPQVWVVSRDSGQIAQIFVLAERMSWSLAESKAGGIPKCSTGHGEHVPVDFG